jgi:hypothetical protein
MGNGVFLIPIGSIGHIPMLALDAPTPNHLRRNLFTRAGQLFPGPPGHFQRVSYMIFWDSLAI